MVARVELVMETGRAGAPGRLLYELGTRRVSTRWILFNVLVVLNLLDLIFTHVGLQRGVLVEDNPLMREVVKSLWLAASVKVLALATVAGLMWLIRSRRRLVEGTLAVCIAWYTFVVVWNYSLLLSA
ncbi:MAG: hypothetical protein HKN26_12640 [Acidimicrobiales bacterium]|nr:hypothetical protein [Acidimicrobiales bacterium]